MRDRRLLLGLLALVALVPRSACAQAPTTALELTPGSRVWLQGTTNVNRWQCVGDRLGGAAAVGGPPDVLAERLAQWEAQPAGTSLLAAEADDDATPATLELRIPIAALDCSNRVMERDLRQALQATRFPHITYAFRALRAARLTSAGTLPSYALTVEGDLTIAGQTRRVSLPVVATRDGRRFHLRGGLALRMTDFGVQPPVALLGLVRAHDALWVWLDLELITSARDALRGGPR